MWRDAILPAYRSGYGGPGVVLTLGWLLATARAIGRVARGQGRELPPAVIVTVCAVPLLVAAYCVTPYSAIGPEGLPFVEANLRWLLPALLCAACAGAWALAGSGNAPGWRPRSRWSSAIVVTIRDGIELPLSTVAAVSASLLGLAAAVVAVAAGVRRGGATRVAAVAGALALVTLAVAVGDRRQERFNRTRYSQDAVTAALASPETRAERVGLAGVWTNDGVSPILPAFGSAWTGRCRSSGSWRTVSCASTRRAVPSLAR